MQSNKNLTVKTDLVFFVEKMKLRKNWLASSQ